MMTLNTFFWLWLCRQPCKKTMFQHERRVLMRSIVFTVLITIVSTALGTEENWYPFTPGTSPEPSDLSVTGIDITGCTIEVSLQGMWVSTVTEGGQTYHRLRLTGGGRTTDEGLPEMPFIGRFVAVPNGARIEAQIVIEDSLDLVGFTIWPTQKPTPRGMTPEAFERDEVFYGESAPFPDQRLLLGEQKVIRGCTTSLLGIFPIRFFPATNSLRIYRRLRIEIRFVGGGGRFVDDHLRSRYFEPLYARILLNYSALGGADPAIHVREGEGELLILVPDQLLGAVLPLANWRTRCGIPTVVAPLSETGSDTTGIQQYIADAYQTWETPPSVVLLVGDTDLLPTNHRHWHPYDWLIGTDLWYFALDGDDLLPDIHYGRISVENVYQLECILAKLLAYEREPVAGPWNNHVFLASYNEPGMPFITISDSIYTYLVSQGYDCDRAYEDGDPPGNTADVIQNFNQGSFIVNFNDHGYERQWVHPSFSVEDFSLLTNGQMLPMVYNMACYTGYFDAETDDTSGNFDCFCEELLRLSPGGALGVVGSSRICTSPHADELDLGIYDAMWPGFDPNYPGGGSANPWSYPVYSQGAVLNFARWRVYEKLSPELRGGAEPSQRDVFVLWLLEMYHLFGDPSLEIHTAEPIGMTVVHDGTAPTGVTSFTVTVDVDSALVALSRNNELLGRVYTSGGVGQVELDEPLDEPGLMDVVVTAHNHIPYEASVEIVPQTGWYVAVDSVLFEDYWGCQNGLMEQGDSVRITLQVRNVGDIPSPPVVGQLSSQCWMVDIADDVENYEAIPAHETVMGPGDYTLVIEGGAEDGYVVPLSLTLSAGDSVWVSSFAIELHAPILSLLETNIDDSGGNGNGHADPGEVVDLWISLANLGSGTASSVQATLYSESPYVSVANGSAAYPDMQPADSLPNMTAFAVEIAPDCPVGVCFPLLLEIEAFGPLQQTIDGSIGVGTPRVLFVDADTESTDERILLGMEQSGYLFDWWPDAEWVIVPLDTLRRYDAILWSAGDNTNFSLDDDEQEIMTRYLSDGGSLLFDAENYLQFYGDASFTTDVLHVQDYTENIAIDTVFGVDGDPVTHDMILPTDFLYGLNNACDAIVPDAEAVGIFTAGDPPQFTALRYPAAGPSTFRVIFTATPIAAFKPGNPPPHNTESFLRNALDWLLESGDLTPPNHVADLTISLGAEPTSVQLSWSIPWDNVGVEYFRVYRGTTAHFEPGPGSLLGTTVLPTWTDQAGAGSPAINHSYLVVAVDNAENESSPSNRVGEYDFETLDGQQTSLRPGWHHMPESRKD
jgi:hypothetical protein